MPLVSASSVPPSCATSPGFPGARRPVGLQADRWIGVSCTFIDVRLPMHATRILTLSSGSGGTGRTETGHGKFPLQLPKGTQRHPLANAIVESGQWDSNPRHSVWEAMNLQWNSPHSQMLRPRPPSLLPLLKPRTTMRTRLWSKLVLAAVV